jgi:hypothetical protein
MKTKLSTIQQFISSFEYNHTGVAYVRMRRDRGANHVHLAAKELIRESLPIQCVEAVFIALHLTADFTDLVCYPLSFKTRVSSSIYRHIVLAVVHNHMWGSLGISRCESLMFKDLTFKSLADLVNDFKSSYEAVLHDVLKVYVGAPFCHDSADPVQWRALKLRMDRPWAEVVESLDSFSKDGTRGNHRRSKSSDEPRFDKNAKVAEESDHSDASDGEGQACQRPGHKRQTSTGVLGV